MKRKRRRTAIKGVTLAPAIAIVLLGFSSAWAAPPEGRGGGGGGGNTPPPRFSVLEIPVDGDPIEISDPGPTGLVTIAIESAEEGYVSAAFATVDAVDGSVVASGFLPEPPFVNPNSGEPDNGWSSPVDVNVHGEIVGYAATFDPESTGDPSPSRAILWSDNGSGFEYSLLATFPGTTESRAFGTNNQGDIVGNISDGGYGVAVIWDAETLSPTDLNTAQTAAHGWQLLNARDVNDGGLIVGYGLLNGVFRGYVLDIASGDVWAVPLVGPATVNSARRISETGRVIGDAWESGGNPWGSEPDYHIGYSWDGPGTDPVVLPSVVLENTIAVGMNDFSITAGNSIIPTDEQFADDLVATLWEPDDQGNIKATKLQGTIPDNSGYTLIRAHDVNNLGWVSTYVRKRGKSNARYLWRALLLIPTGN